MKRMKKSHKAETEAQLLFASEKKRINFFLSFSVLFFFPRSRSYAPFLQQRIVVTGKSVLHAIPGEARGDGRDPLRRRLAGFAAARLCWFRGSFLFFFSIFVLLFFSSCPFSCLQRRALFMIRRVGNRSLITALFVSQEEKG